MEMTNYTEMTLKYPPRSSKVTPIESLCMISYWYSVLTFAM